jgi:ribosomal protein S27AE
VKKRKFCPRCGSDDLATHIVIYGDNNRYRCRECGYVGVFVVEEDEDGEMSKMIRKKYLENKE